MCASALVVLIIGVAYHTNAQAQWTLTVSNKTVYFCNGDILCSQVPAKYPLPVPGNCTIYQQCTQDGAVVRLACPTSLMFDQVNFTCRSSARCMPACPTTTISPTPQPSSTSDPLSQYIPPTTKNTFPATTPRSTVVTAILGQPMIISSTTIAPVASGPKTGPISPVSTPVSTLVTTFSPSLPLSTLASSASPSTPVYLYPSTKFPSLSSTTIKTDGVTKTPTTTTTATRNNSTNDANTGNAVATTGTSTYSSVPVTRATSTIDDGSVTYLAITKETTNSNMVTTAITTNASTDSTSTTSTSTSNTVTVAATIEANKDSAAVTHQSTTQIYSGTSTGTHLATTQASNNASVFITTSALADSSTLFKSATTGEYENLTTITDSSSTKDFADTSIGTIVATTSATVSSTLVTPDRTSSTSSNTLTIPGTSSSSSSALTPQTTTSSTSSSTMTTLGTASSSSSSTVTPRVTISSTSYSTVTPRVTTPSTSSSTLNPESTSFTSSSPMTNQVTTLSTSSSQVTPQATSSTSSSTVTSSGATRAATQTAVGESTFAQDSGSSGTMATGVVTGVPISNHSETVTSIPGSPCSAEYSMNCHLAFLDFFSKFQRLDINEENVVNVTLTLKNLTSGNSLDTGDISLAVTLVGNLSRVPVTSPAQVQALLDVVSNLMNRPLTMNNSERLMFAMDEFIIAVSTAGWNNQSMLRMITDNILLEIASFKRSNTDLPSISLPMTLGQDQVTIDRATWLSALSDSTVRIPTLLYKTKLPAISDLTLSRILAVSLGSHALVNLHPPIHLTLSHIEPGSGLQTECAFWNYTRQRWDTAGCTVTHRQPNRTSCDCNHLTNFAIIVTPNARTTGIHGQILSIISIVGCIVSIVCLLLTIIVHVASWKYLRSHHAVVLISLCVVLIIGNAFFLAVDQTANKILCRAIAIILHYFFLASFFLMCAEGVQLLIYTIYVFHVRRRRETAAMIVTALFLPMIVVGTTIGITRLDGYGNDQHCWLTSRKSVIWAFLAPVIAIIVINCGITVAVLRKVALSRRKKGRTVLCDSGVASDVWAILWNIMVISPVLGLSWIPGIISIHTHSLALQYIFCIANGLQGVLIFIFHAACHKKRLAGTSSGSTSTPKYRPQTSLSTQRSRINSHKTSVSSSSSSTESAQRKVSQNINIYETIPEEQFSITQDENNPVKLLKKRYRNSNGSTSSHLPGRATNNISWAPVDPSSMPTATNPLAEEACLRPDEVMHIDLLRTPSCFANTR